MSSLRSLSRRLRMPLTRRRLEVWSSAGYRLPIPSLAHVRELEPRRADFAAQTLDVLGRGRVTLREPQPISYDDIHRVHSERLVASLTDPAELARIFGSEPDRFPVGEVLNSVRLATGGTLAAARKALELQSATLNLLGGFHHAGPDVAGGLCPINDIAIALGRLREEGFSGRVNIIDVDAHPPDGLAGFFGRDDEVYVGSLSGSDWGPLEGVDETVIEGAGDHRYLAELRRLLDRLPEPELTFVIAGGDVLADDHLGALNLTPEGVRKRDAILHRSLGQSAQVWLPGGGYHAESWRLLVRTGLVLLHRSRQRIPRRPPLREKVREVWLGDLQDLDLTEGDVEADLFGNLRPAAPLLVRLGEEELSRLLSTTGITGYLERLGYQTPAVIVDEVDQGYRFRVQSTSGAETSTLIEAVFEERPLRGERVLFVHWLTMRDPRSEFSADRPPLPGQEHPGLGLMPEAVAVVLALAERLKLDGVGFRPAHLHVAYAAREFFWFSDPERQERAAALYQLLDDDGVDLARLSDAAETEGLWLNGVPYAWEPEPMVHLFHHDRPAAGPEPTGGLAFSLTPPPQQAPPSA